MPMPYWKVRPFTPFADFDDGERRRTSRRRAAHDGRVASPHSFLSLPLPAVIAKVEPGSTSVELCQLGDRLIEEKVSKIFNKKVSPQGPLMP